MAVVLMIDPPPLAAMWRWGCRHPRPIRRQPDAAMLAFVRICTHYFANAAWLEDGQLLRNAHKLAGISAVLIHGCLDMSSPVRTAWQLASVWPDAELRVKDDSSHTGSPLCAPRSSRRSPGSRGRARARSGRPRPARNETEPALLVIPPRSNPKLVLNRLLRGSDCRQRQTMPAPSR
jgi:hypothetical protein